MASRPRPDSRSEGDAPAGLVPALFLCVFLPAFGTHGLNPVLPEMERALGLQGQSLPTLLSSAFSLGATLAYL